MRAFRLRRARPLSAAALVLHLSAVLLLPAADSRLEAAALGDRTHVESERQASCLPAHDHLVCQVCRAASQSLASAAEHPTPAFDRIVKAAPPAWQGRAAGRPDLRQPSCRAPPPSV